MMGCIAWLPTTFPNASWDTLRPLYRAGVSTSSFLSYQEKQRQFLSGGSKNPACPQPWDPAEGCVWGGVVHGRAGYLVTKLSASRSSTVCLSMLGGTKSRPFLAQRVARLGERIWHTQRLGQICARTAMATASITHSNSLSMVATQPGHDTCRIGQRDTYKESKNERRVPPGGSNPQQA